MAISPKLQSRPTTFFPRSRFLAIDERSVEDQPNQPYPSALQDSHVKVYVLQHIFLDINQSISVRQS